MSEITMDGDWINDPGEWSLDGWSNGDRFSITISGEFAGDTADLTIEHCSMLLAALIEHIKEVNDASKENSR